MMETPTSDFGSNGDITPSEPSTPSSPYEPFVPRFKVKVTEPVKDGDTLTYTVHTSEFPAGKDYSVYRKYEDFEYLHHCLSTSENSRGIIMPPLPSKPALDPRDVSSISKRQLGDNSKILMGDRFHQDCRSLEMYLKLVINHQILGLSHTLQRFLIQEEPSEPVQIKKGILGKISSIVEEARKAHHRDVDDFYQKERDWTNEYCRNMKHLFECFNKLVCAEQKISGAYAHLCTTLNMGGGYDDEDAIRNNSLMVRFSEALEDAKHGCDVDIVNNENTLGFHLEHESRYADSLKDMLFQRTCLMVEYEEANRSLEKAKLHKRDEAEKYQLSAERAFEECSEVGRREIQVFKKQRILRLQEGLNWYAEAKIKTARDTYALLAKSLAHFKKLQL